MEFGPQPVEGLGRPLVNSGAQQGVVNQPAADNGAGLVAESVGNHGRGRYQLAAGLLHLAVEPSQNLGVVIAFNSTRCVCNQPRHSRSM